MLTGSVAKFKHSLKSIDITAVYPCLQ